jgi:hypothetical protein
VKKTKRAKNKVFVFFMKLKIAQFDEDQRGNYPFCRFLEKFYRNFAFRGQKKNVETLYFISNCLKFAAN